MEKETKFGKEAEIRNFSLAQMSSAEYEKNFKKARAVIEGIQSICHRSKINNDNNVSAFEEIFG